MQQAPNVRILNILTLQYRDVAFLQSSVSDGDIHNSMLF